MLVDFSTDFSSNAQSNEDKMKNEWISIKDRLPENFQNIIVGRVGEPNVMAIISYQDSYAYDYYWGSGMDIFAKPTHWMPLPPPPKK